MTHKITCPNCHSPEVWVQSDGIEIDIKWPQALLGDAFASCECRKCKAKWTLIANNWKVVKCNRT